MGEPLLVVAKLSKKRQVYPRPTTEIHCFVGEDTILP